jgi:two-component system sensor histidine kinase and response regulator WspE
MAKPAPLGDFSMLDIFRQEVETHAERLTAGLLSLEQQAAGPKEFESLMRAAHSIKGAARIVGIDPAVQLAHAMEDAFVAAQHGKISLAPESVDSLLRGVDVLNQVGQLSSNPPADWTAALGDAQPRLVAEITSIAAGKSAPKPMAPPKPETPPPAKKPTQSIVVGSAEDHVRITVAGTVDDELRRSLVEQLQSKPRKIVIDLAQTPSITASGLALLKILEQTLERERQPPMVALGGVAPGVAAVLRATGLNRRLRIEAEAS